MTRISVAQARKPVVDPVKQINKLYPVVTQIANKPFFDKEDVTKLIQYFELGLTLGSSSYNAMSSFRAKSKEFEALKNSIKGNQKLPNEQMGLEHVLLGIYAKANAPGKATFFENMLETVILYQPIIEELNKITGVTWTIPDSGAAELGKYFGGLYVGPNIALKTSEIEAVLKKLSSTRFKARLDERFGCVVENIAQYVTSSSVDEKWLELQMKSTDDVVEQLNRITKDFFSNKNKQWKYISKKNLCCYFGSEEEIIKLYNYFSRFLPAEALKKGSKPDDPQVWGIYILEPQLRNLKEIPALSKHGKVTDLVKKKELKDEDFVELFPSLLPEFIYMGDKPPLLGGVIKPVPLDKAKKELKHNWIESIRIKKSDLNKRNTSQERNGKHTTMGELQEIIMKTYQMSKNIALCVMKDEKTGEDWGRGLFALEDIDEGEPIKIVCGDAEIYTNEEKNRDITDYTYAVSNPDWAHKHMVEPYNHTRYFQHGVYSRTKRESQGLNINSDEIYLEDFKIDGSCKEPIAECNTYRVRRDFNGWPLEVITAARKIKKGEQILAEYTTEYWIRREKMFGLCTEKGAIVDPKLITCTKRFVQILLPNNYASKVKFMDIKEIEKLDFIQVTHVNDVKSGKNEIYLCYTKDIVKEVTDKKLLVRVKAFGKIYEDYDSDLKVSETSAITKPMVGSALFDEKNRVLVKQICERLDKKTGLNWLEHPHLHTLYITYKFDKKYITEILGSLCAMNSIGIKEALESVNTLYERLKANNIAVEKGFSQDMRPILIINEALSETLLKKIEQLSEAPSASHEKLMSLDEGNSM